MIFTKYYSEFITVICLEWLPVLANDKHKEIITESLRFLVKEKRVHVYDFVLMSTHFHLIWQVMGDHKREDVQRDFLRFTAQQILKQIRNDNSPLLEQLVVNAKDRKRQVWERNSLSIELRTAKVYDQKLDYIHYNPVLAGLCNYPEEYYYSSAKFYELNENTWDFLSHGDG